MLLFLHAPANHTRDFRPIKKQKLVNSHRCLLEDPTMILLLLSCRMRIRIIIRSFMSRVIFYGIVCKPRAKTWHSLYILPPWEREGDIVQHICVIYQIVSRTKDNERSHSVGSVGSLNLLARKKTMTENRDPSPTNPDHHLTRTSAISI